MHGCSRRGGGGHNYNDASSSKGLIISTRKMSKPSLTGSTLHAEAGVRNADLAALLPKGGACRHKLGEDPDVIMGIVIHGQFLYVDRRR